MLRSKFGNNVNKYALAMWESSWIPLEDKFEALCDIDIPEFKDVSHGVVIAFNLRTGATCEKLKDIDKKKVVQEDLDMVELCFPGLVKAVKTQDAVEGIMKSLEVASVTHSRREIMNTFMNTLIGFRNGTIPLNDHEMEMWAKNNREKVMDVSQHDPTFVELQSLELTDDQIRLYQAILSKE